MACSNFFLTFFSAFMFGLLLDPSKATQTADICEKWENVAHAMSGTGKIQHCTNSPSPDCAQIDCSGSTKFSHKSFHGISIPQFEVDYCLGTRLNSCNHPISMDFYLVVPEKNFSKSIRISKDESINISGLEYKVGFLGAASPDLVFVFEKQDDGSIKFSAKVKVRISSHGQHFYVDDWELPLIHEAKLHALPCQSTTQTSPNDILKTQCHPGQKAAVVSSTTFNKPCDFTSKFCSQGEVCDSGVTPHICICSSETEFHSDVKACVPTSRFSQPCSGKELCGKNEVCVAADSGDSACQCKNGYSFDRRKQICQDDQTHGGKDHPVTKPTPSGHPVHHPTASGPVTPAPPTSNHSGGSTPRNQTKGNTQNSTTSDSNNSTGKPASKNLTVIVGGIVGGVVFVASIVIMSVFFRRWYRQRQHMRGGWQDGSDSPLMDADDDDALLTM